jgi:hypothetical protein
MKAMRVRAPQAGPFSGRRATMEESEYEYKVQFRRPGESIWYNLMHHILADINDARALKRRCERTYGTYKGLKYRIVRRPKNWEPCE